MRISSPFPSPWVASVLVVLTCGICAAQSRTFTGNWHLNVAKSRWGSVTKPVSVAIVIDHRGQEISYHGAVTYANEDTREFAFAGAFDGKPYQMTRSYGNGMITLHKVDDSTFSSTFTTGNGLYTETANTTLSRDGRTMTRKLSMRSPEGSRSWTEVYEKR